MAVKSAGGSGCSQLLSTWSKLSATLFSGSCEDTAGRNGRVTRLSVLVESVCTHCSVTAGSGGERAAESPRGGSHSSEELWG